MRRVPTVTLLLIAANIIAAFFLLLQPGLVVDLGFRPQAPSPRSVITSLFLHANVLHLLGNMVFLAVVGAAVEMATGSFRFATVYFLSGIVGVAMHYIVTRHHPEPAVLIGASGAIAGCAGYYSVRYQGLRIPLSPTRSVSVLTVTGVWLALQVLGAFIRLGEGETGGTSYWAHLGGFAAGIVISFIFRAPDPGQVRLGHQMIEEMEDRSPGAMVAAAREHLRRHPHDPLALQKLAEALAMQDDLTGETSALVGLLDAAPPDELPQTLRRLCEIGRAAALPSIRRTLLAERLKNYDPETAMMLLQTVVTGDPNDSQRPEALLALAGLQRERDPEKANRLLSELSRSYPLHPAVELARKRGWLA